MDKTEVEQLRERVAVLEERERRARLEVTGVTWQPGGRLEEEITRLRIAATGAPDAWRAAADEWTEAGEREVLGGVDPAPCHRYRWGLMRGRSECRQRGGGAHACERGAGHAGECRCVCGARGRGVDRTDGGAA